MTEEIKKDEEVVEGTPTQKELEDLGIAPDNEVVPEIPRETDDVPEDEDDEPADEELEPEVA